MPRSRFKKRLQNEILILDGSMGTMLQPHLPAGACPDYAVMTHPDIVRDVHKAYISAGADIILTDTFGGTRTKLNEYKLGDRVNEINLRAAQLAREAAGSRAWVAGSIGPTGKLVEPMGDLTFNDAYAVYQEQARALQEGGVDLFILETFADLKEIKAALMAVRETTHLPVMAAMTFSEDMLTFTGTDPETAAVVLTSLGADAVGVNCSLGPNEMPGIVERLAGATDLPIFVEPNAGIPQLDGTETVHTVTPDEMADSAALYIELGASIVGTCCGSTPEFTQRVHDRIKKLKTNHKPVPARLSLTSRFSSVHIGPGMPFGVIGERINTTNRKKLAADIQERQYIILKNDVAAQVDAGANIIDLNIAIPGMDEPAIMAEIVQNLDTTLKAPLCIDSKEEKAIEAALRESAGKALINSVTGEAEKMEHFFPLAKKYGAALICLAIDEKGIPDNARDRIKIIEKLLKQADDYGIDRRNLIIDCLAMTVSTQQEGALETLKAIRAMREDFGLPTVLGISNISFGLPGRSLLTSSYLNMAMAAGLDSAIMNPLDERMMDAVRAASVFTLRDPNAQIYTQIDFGTEKAVVAAKGGEQNGALTEIYNAVITGNRESIAPLVNKALEAGHSAAQINDESLITAINEVGLRYEKKEFFLPQMILSADTFQAAFKVLQPHFENEDVQIKGRIVLCTVKGDLHSIGKNIVRLLLGNAGYEVTDLGIDVPAEEIYDKAIEVNADVVGLSALMTTTMTEMGSVISYFRERGSDIPVIIGGAAVTQDFADRIGAAGFSTDGVQAVKLVDSLVGG